MSKVRKSELFDQAVNQIEAAKANSGESIIITITLKDEFTGSENKFKKFLKRAKVKEYTQKLREMYQGQYTIKSSVDTKTSGYFLCFSSGSCIHDSFTKILWTLQLNKLC